MRQKQEDKESYQLLSANEELLSTIHQWNIHEIHMDYYSCRPIHTMPSQKDYIDSNLSEIATGKKQIFVLADLHNEKQLYGRITLFDINSRNHSAEFGYHMPEGNRGCGLGSIMLQLFMETVYNNKELDLHKLYATTSSNNKASIHLLEKHGFQLDGRMRDHYWINEERYDQLVYSILKREWATLYQ